MEATYISATSMGGKHLLISCTAQSISGALCLVSLSTRDGESSTLTCSSQITRRKIPMSISLSYKKNHLRSDQALSTMNPKWVLDRTWKALHISKQQCKNVRSCEKIRGEEQEPSRRRMSSLKTGSRTVCARRFCAMLPCC